MRQIITNFEATRNRESLSIYEVEKIKNNVNKNNLLQLSIVVIEVAQKDMFAIIRPVWTLPEGYQRLLKFILVFVCLCVSMKMSQ